MNSLGLGTGGYDKGLGTVVKINLIKVGGY